MRNNTIALLLFATLFSTKLAAQKFGKPVLGAGRSVMISKVIGVINNQEIVDGAKKLLVYEDGKEKYKDGISVIHNDQKYVPNSYKIIDNKLVGYFIAGRKNSEKVFLCLQEFDDKLQQIGSPIEVIELPRAVDLKTHSTALGLKETLIKHQKLDVSLNKKTGTLLFTFSLQLMEKHNLSYAKVVLVDKNYKVLNSYEYQASSTENYIKAVPLQIYDTDDALVSISEGKDEIVNNSTMFGIVNQFLITISEDGAKELELMPDQARIMKSISANNTDRKGNITYAIQSFLDKNPDGTKNTKEAFIGLYNYDKASDKLSRISMAYNIDDLIDNKEGSVTTYRINKMFNLPDGSFLLILNAHNSIEYVLKFDKDNNLLWTSKARRQVSGTYEFTSSLDYFDESGNLNLVFNYHPKLIVDNKLVENKLSMADYGSIPVKAIIDNNTGEVTYEKINGGNLELRGIKMTDCIYLGENGKYLLHMVIDKKLQFVEVDFSEN